MPFRTVQERNEVFSARKGSVQDGLVDAIKTMRNCEMLDIRNLFGSVANTYRAMQEWCAPRILVDGTEAYSAVPEWSLVEAKHVLLDPDFVHLLRNPRECLGNAQGSSIVELEKKWVEFTKYMLHGEGTNMFKIRYEDLNSTICAILSCLSIPNHTAVSVDDSQHDAELVFEGPLQSDTRVMAWHLGYPLSDHANKFQFVVREAKQRLVTWL